MHIRTHVNILCVHTCSNTHAAGLSLSLQRIKACIITINCGEQRSPHFLFYLLWWAVVTTLMFYLLWWAEVTTLCVLFIMVSRGHHTLSSIYYGEKRSPHFMFYLVWWEEVTALRVLFSMVRRGHHTLCSTYYGEQWSPYYVLFTMMYRKGDTFCWIAQVDILIQYL